jgi:precorrin-3B synthase
VPAPARDACPGLLALHPARDGHVARIRLPGGYAAGPRWRALAGLAADLGDGQLDLTSRGNVQLRGLRPADAAELSARAQSAGLLPSAAHDRARNIMASPLGTLRALTEELDAALLADPGLAALPGRFLFSLDDGTGGAGLAGCDVGLLRGELVIAGRTAGVRGGAALAVAAARAAVAGGVGGAVTRIADLPDGGAAVAAALGGALGGPAARPDVRLPLGPAGSGQPETSSITMVAGARLGRLTVGQAGLVADLLAPGEVIRLGVAGRIVIPLAAGRPDAPARLAAAGLLVTGDDPLAGVTACSGTACSRAVADVRAAARPVPGHARTHWAGCARQCGLPPDAEAVIAVGADHYQIAGRPLAGAR